MTRRRNGGRLWGRGLKNDGNHPNSRCDYFRSEYLKTAFGRDGSRGRGLLGAPFPALGYLSPARKLCAGFVRMTTGGKGEDTDGCAKGAARSYTHRSVSYSFRWESCARSTITRPPSLERRVLRLWLAFQALVPLGCVCVGEGGFGSPLAPGGLSPYLVLLSPAPSVRPRPKKVFPAGCALETTRRIAALRDR